MDAFLWISMAKHKASTLHVHFQVSNISKRNAGNHVNMTTPEMINDFRSQMQGTNLVRCKLN